MTDDKDSTSSGDVINDVCEEAKQSLQHQTEVMSDIDTKAIKIFRANILILTIIVSAASIVVRTDADVLRLVNILTIAGVISIIASIASAGITYASTSLEVGIGHESLQDYLEEGYDETTHRKKILKGYINWIQYNDITISINSFFSTITIIFTINSLIFLTFGVLYGLVAHSLTHLIFTIITSCLLAIGIDYIIYQVDTYIEDYHESERIFSEEA